MNEWKTFAWSPNSMNWYKGLHNLWPLCPLAFSLAIPKMSLKVQPHSTSPTSRMWKVGLEELSFIHSLFFAWCALPSHSLLGKLLLLLQKSPQVSPHPEYLLGKVQGAPIACPLPFVHNPWKSTCLHPHLGLKRPQRALACLFPFELLYIMFHSSLPLPSSTAAQSRKSGSVQMKVSFNITCFMTLFARCWVEGRASFHQEAANLRGKMPWVVTQGDNGVL